MLKSDKVVVTVMGSNIKWYKAKGYIIPTYDVQLWANKNGKKVKNGIDNRIKMGTTIEVNINDLPPSSNTPISLICTQCSKEYTLPFFAYSIKKTNYCSTCSKKKTKGDGSHSYWVNKLITINNTAKCDISGETDKRFLVLHHLNSRANGGTNTDDNYVILSANYHMAFHNWNGGMNIPCTKEGYINFKNEELKIKN